VELDDITLRIARGQCGALLSSARELVSVKIDAIEHAERAVRKGSASPTDLERHRAELAIVERLVDELDRLGRRPDDQDVTARRALLDEIIVNALAIEAQELADGILASIGANDLSEIRARLSVVDGLMATLATVRHER
jgi:hypothetical protein